MINIPNFVIFVSFVVNINFLFVAAAPRCALCG